MPTAMKKQLKIGLLISFVVSLPLFAGPLENKYPMPPSMSKLEKDPRSFLKFNKDYERMKEALYSEDMSAEIFKFMVKHKNKLNKIKAKMYSKRDGGARGKVLYFYKDFKNEKFYLKLRDTDVVNINAVLLGRNLTRRLKGRTIRFKRYFDNVDVNQVGVSKNYRYTSRKKTDDFVKKKLKVLTIRRNYKYYMKNYDINVYKFNNLPPKVNKVIIYTRNQKINIKQSK